MTGNLHYFEPDDFLPPVRHGFWVATRTTDGYIARTVETHNFPKRSLVSYMELLQLVAEGNDTMHPWDRQLELAQWQYHPYAEHSIHKVENSWTFTTFAPLAAMARLQSIHVSDPSANAGFQCLRVRSTGDVTCLGPPVTVKHVNQNRFNKTFVTFSVFHVSNSPGGTVTIVGAQKLGDVTDAGADSGRWHVLPPYDNYVAYVEFKVGEMILKAKTYLMNKGGKLQISDVVASKAHAMMANALPRINFVHRNNYWHPIHPVPVPGPE